MCHISISQVPTIFSVSSELAEHISASQSLPAPVLKDRSSYIAIVAWRTLSESTKAETEYDESAGEEVKRVRLGDSGTRRWQEAAKVSEIVSRRNSSQNVPSVKQGGLKSGKYRVVK